MTNSAPRMHLSKLRNGAMSSAVLKGLMCDRKMARPVTAWPSLGRGSWHARSAKLVAICLLGSCVVLLLPIAGTGAAGRHAATSHSGAVAGTGRSAGARLQVGRAHVSGRREFRRSAVSRTLARHRRRTDQRAAKYARRPGHPSPRSAPAEVSGQSLSSIPHRTQSMPEGQPLPAPVPRQILVLLDQDQPQALGRARGTPIPVTLTRQPAGPCSALAPSSCAFGKNARWTPYSPRCRAMRASARPSPISGISRRAAPARAIAIGGGSSALLGTKRSTPSRRSHPSIRTAQAEAAGSPSVGAWP